MEISSVADPNPDPSYPFFLGLLDPDPDPLVRSMDPNPDLSDPYVCGPPGSGSFFQQAKIVRKTLIPTALLLLFDFLSSKNDVNLSSKSKKQDVGRRIPNT